MTETGTAPPRWTGPSGGSPQRPPLTEIAAVLRAIREVIDLPSEDAERQRVIARKRDLVDRIELYEGRVPAAQTPATEPPALGV